MTLLTKAMEWVKSRSRLIIEYALIILFMVLGVYGTFAYFRARDLTKTTITLSEKLGTVSNTLDQQVQANKDQDVAIADLARLRQIDSKALEGLHQELDKADTKGETLRQKVRQLEKTNADAKALLDTAVPPALGCLLDGTPCPGGNKPDSGEASPPP
jgi:ABC-type transporter Mla subunit MlaD